MTTVNSVGIPPRQINGLAYTASTISLTPVINLQKNPTTHDRFPIMTFARNGDPNDADYGAIWYLQKYEGVTGDKPDAIWVRLSSGTAGPIVSFDVPLGTSPVDPDGGGTITLTSAAGTIDITGGTNSINFDLAGGGVAIDAINIDASTPPGTDPVVSDGTGQITVTGAQVAAGAVGTNVIRTDSLAANTYTIEIQRSTSAASTTVASNGVSHYSSAQFDVDSNAFVTLKGSTGPAATKFNVDTSSGAGTDPVVPDSSGIVTVTGAQIATGTIGANVIRTISTAANSYTIQVQQTDAVAAKDTTKNGVCHFNSAQFSDDEGFISLIGDAGFSSIVVQVFTSNGTYTPTANMQYCMVEVVGGGGGGGATANTAAGTVACAGGGGGGGYARKVFSAATIGVSQAVTVGAGGTAGAVTSGSGGAGGTTSLGALISATGGNGGGGAGALAGCTAQGGPGGLGSGGDFNAHGGVGQPSFGTTAAVMSGSGGNSIYGGGGQANTATSVGDAAGGAGTTYGGGGSGALTATSSNERAGGAGAAGIVIITEYVL